EGSVQDRCIRGQKFTAWPPHMNWWGNQGVGRLRFFYARTSVHGSWVVRGVLTARVNGLVGGRSWGSSAWVRMRCRISVSLRCRSGCTGCVFVSLGSVLMVWSVGSGFPWVLLVGSCGGCVSWGWCAAVLLPPQARARVGRVWVW